MREVAFLGPQVPGTILEYFKKTTDIKLNDLEIDGLFDLLGPKITDVVRS
jgi:hypothetical protein